MHSKSMSTKQLKPRKLLKITQIKPPPMKNSSEAVYPDWLRVRGDFQLAMKESEDIDSKEIKRILLCCPIERSPNDKQVFINWIKGINFFSKLSMIKVKELIANFSVETIEKSKTIQKAELTCFFYMIVVGELSFYDNERRRKVRSTEIFTEYSLLNTLTFPQQLTATQCTTLLKLSKEQYNDILLSMELSEKYEISKFIKKNKFFSNWSIGKIGILVSKLIILNLQKGQLAFRIDDPSKNFYIIKSGVILEQVNVSLNYTNSWPIKLDLKEKLYVNKKYLVDFQRHESGEIFGLCDTVYNKTRETQAIAVKNSQLLVIPIEFLTEFLSDSEKIQVKAYGEIESEKAELLQAKRKQIQSTNSQSKLILNAFEVNLRPVSNIFKNPDIDRKVACAKKIVYSRIDTTNKELKEVRSHTRLFNKGKLLKRCCSRDDSYMYKSGIIL